MVLIYGGAYQGKRDFAKERFNLKDGGIYECTGDNGVPERIAEHKCIYNFHLLVYALLQSGKDPLAYVTENIGAFDGKIIISDDISCGVVPMGAENRAWREAAGRCLTYLSKNAAEVWRVFCGIPTKLK